MRKYNKKSVPVYVNGGKIAGIVRGKVFDVRKHKEHLLEIPPAICLSVEALKAAESMGAEEVQVTVIETNKVYQQTISKIEKFSHVQRRGGFEPQRVVCLEYWIVIREADILLDRDAPLPPLLQPKTQIEQMSLFR